MKLIILISLTFLSLPLMAGQVCRHDLDIRGAVVPGDGTRGVLGQRVANFLTRQNLGSSCVDLRSLGMSTSFQPPRGAGNQERGVRTQDETIGFVLNGPLDVQKKDLLTREICQGMGSQCQASLTFRCAQISNLRFNHDIVGQGQGIMRGPERTAPVGNLPSLPRFSAACSTGQNQDSWNDAASTPESRQLLESAGLNIPEIRSLSIEEGNENFWTFGFPDHRRDNANSPQLPTQPIRSGQGQGVDI